MSNTENTILILKPQEMCYHLLDTFAEEFGQALESFGYTVLYFDLKSEPVQMLAKYLSVSVVAVIDMYSGLLGVKDAQSDGYFFNQFHAPVYQFVFDYPLFIRDKMGAQLQHYNTLMLDENHVSLVERCFPNIRKAYLLPPTGVACADSEIDGCWEKRPYDVTFVGTYTDYHVYMDQLSQCTDQVRYLASTYLRNMIDTQMDQESALDLTLEQLGINVKAEERYLWVEQLGSMSQCAAAYYRGMIIQTLVEAGIDVHVYGDSWKNAEYGENPHLHIHPQMNPADYPAVMSKSKIALNILPWNKRGISERLFYGLLNGALCISERNSYIEQLFTDQKELIFYTYSEINKLPDRIRYYLDHVQESSIIAANGQKCAVQNHTWNKRVEEFVQILEQDK